MRLIDVDALADALFEKRKNYPQWVADTIGNMPDAVVRCRDCKYSMEAVFGSGRYCGLHKKSRAEEWFCADGERKDSDA